MGIFRRSSAGSSASRVSRPTTASALSQQSSPLTTAAKKLHSPPTPRARKVGGVLKKKSSGSSGAAMKSAPTSPAAKPAAQQIPPAEQPSSMPAAAPASAFLATPVVAPTTPAAAAPAPTSALASSDAPVRAPSAAPDTAMDSEEFSPAEQKMLATISGVADKIEQIALQLPTLRGQLQWHRAKLALFKWAHGKLKTLDATKLNLAHKSLRYNISGVDEGTLQQIFKLDSVQTDNATVRAKRKAAVKRGNEVIKEAVALRERVDRLQRFLPPMPPAPVESATMEDIAPKHADSENEKAECASMMSDEDNIKPEPKVEPAKRASPPVKRNSPPPVPQQRAEPPAPKAAVVQEPTPLSALERKYSHLKLPTYAGPTFYQRVHPHTGALLIESDLEGVLPDDVTVTPDAKDRTVTIRGVRLPERRRSAPHPFGGLFGSAYGMPPQRLSPHGFFSKVIVLDELDPNHLLDDAKLEAALNRDGSLTISVPRAVRVQPKPVRQAPAPQYRAPVSHRSYATHSSEEEEDAADAFSRPIHNPYYSRSQPRSQPAYRRSPQPFFGGFF